MQIETSAAGKKKSTEEDYYTRMKELESELEILSI